MSDFISLQDYKNIQNSVSLAVNTGKFVVSGIELGINIATATVSNSVSLGIGNFLLATKAIVGALGLIGAVLFVGGVVYGMLSAMWSVDSIKRKRDKVLLVFRKSKRVLRCIDPNKVIKYGITEYLNNQLKTISELKKEINTNDIIKKVFISSFTNTYLLSNPISTYLINEQNMLNLIKQNNIEYISVLSFKDYISEYNILELDKIRINTADNETLSMYIDSLNAILVMIDQISMYNLENQTKDDIAFIKDNVLKLLNYIKSNYSEQIKNQDISDPELMLTELTENLPLLDLSSYNIGNLQNFPQEKFNEIFSMLKMINTKSLMTVIFNNIYIEKFINIMLIYKKRYENKDISLLNDIDKLINKSVTAYNLLNKIIGLKILYEKIKYEDIESNVNIEMYRQFFEIKNIFVDMIVSIFNKINVVYNKSNGVTVTNNIKFVNDLKLIEDNFYTKIPQENFLKSYIEFNTVDKNQQINNIDVNSIIITDSEYIYKELSSIFEWLYNHGITIEKININNWNDLNYFVYNILSQIQKNIDKYYYNSNFISKNIIFKNYKISENTLLQYPVNEIIDYKECINLENLLLNKINDLYSELYKIRFDFAYEYSILSDLFINKQEYFFFEIFSKIESIVNSSNSLILNNDISNTQYGIQINFYDILFEFFTKYINNYSGYILSKNKYLNNLTQISQTNYLSTISIACKYETLDIKQQNIEIQIDDKSFDTSLISDEELLSALNKNIDNYNFSTEIISNKPEIAISENEINKINSENSLQTNSKPVLLTLLSLLLINK